MATGPSEMPSLEHVLIDRMTRIENDLARLKTEVATKDDVQAIRGDIASLAGMTSEVLGVVRETMAIVRETSERVDGIDVNLNDKDARIGRVAIPGVMQPAIRL